MDGFNAHAKTRFIFNLTYSVAQFHSKQPPNAADYFERAATIVEVKPGPVTAILDDIRDIEHYVKTAKMVNLYANFDEWKQEYEINSYRMSDD